jgi:hypothetical protein
MGFVGYLVVQSAERPEHRPGMKRFLAQAVASLALWLPCAAEAVPSAHDDVCGQVVVLGRVAHATWIGSMDYAEWRYDVDVKRVLRGPETRRRVTTTAAGEAELRADRDFVFYLFPEPNGEYDLSRVDMALHRARSRIARCSRVSDPRHRS